ncbi:MAG: hypothetical protein A2161_02225 [Candidatus Schekmanbacteria bacterium RBG_13_48_7]|uniref:Uncharacterized protein n=1 Tax=Candidatus Schekmanbacteria bacterium RBG_13_48_7 TaxID=1817878 RepID=A0A1F7RQY8_9BACT|nr:MAG: hypothetical protein A2161_02225 [Candidatus Schekmanbacteria bacterium RBG_13_48_7]
MEADNEEDRERLAGYIARAPISNKKITYDQEKDVIVYTTRKEQNSLPGFRMDQKEDVSDPFDAFN